MFFHASSISALCKIIRAYEFLSHVSELKSKHGRGQAREWLALELARSGPLRAGLHLAEHAGILFFLKI